MKAEMRFIAGIMLLENKLPMAVLCRIIDNFIYRSVGVRL